MVNLKNYMLSSNGSRNMSISSGSNNRYSGNAVLQGEQPSQHHTRQIKRGVEYIDG